jgi:hypothetical protein
MRSRARLAAAIGAAFSLAGCSLIYSVGDISSVGPSNADGGSSDGTTTSDGRIDGGSSSIAFVAASSRSSDQASESATTATPSGTLPGDFVWVVVIIDEEASMTPPPAWQKAAMSIDNNLGFAVEVFDFVATATDPPYTVSFNMTGDWSMTASVYRNAEPTFDVDPTITAASPPYNAAPVTTRSAGDYVLYAYIGESGDGTWTTPSGLTMRSQTDYIFNADVLQAAIGPTANEAAGYSSSSHGFAITAAIAHQ